MHHHPVYLIVSPSGAVLETTPHPHLVEALRDSHAERDWSYPGFRIVRPSVVEGSEVDLLLDCGALGERAATVVYTRDIETTKDRWTVTIHSGPVRIRKISVSGIGRVSLPDRDLSLLAMRIEDDLEEAEEAA